MRSAGFAVTHELGRGMEGVVAALDAEHVVKVWDRRPLAEVERLRTFYDAVGAGLREAGVDLTVPRITAVVEADGLVLTVHPRLRGRPGGPGPGPVVEVLAGLAQVEPHPDMAVLPVPDGEVPFDPAVPFGESMAALVRRRARWSRTGSRPTWSSGWPRTSARSSRWRRASSTATSVRCTCSSRADDRPGCSTSATSRPSATPPSTPLSPRACRTCSVPGPQPPRLRSTRPRRPGSATTRVRSSSTARRTDWSPPAVSPAIPGPHVDWCLALVETWARRC